MKALSLLHLRRASLAAIAAAVATTTAMLGSESAANTHANPEHAPVNAVPTSSTTASSTQPAQGGSTGTPSAGAPTGRTSADNVDPVLRSAARSVRQIWDADPDLAKLDLRVTPTATGLLFEGMVPNAETWERAKDTAEGVITRIAIDNRIKIRTDFPKAAR